MGNTPVRALGGCGRLRPTVKANQESEWLPAPSSVPSDVPWACQGTGGGHVLLRVGVEEVGRWQGHQERRLRQKTSQSLWKGLGAS